MVSVLFQKMRHLRRRGLAGLLRGVRNDSGDPDTPRLKKLDSWLTARAGAITELAGQTFTAEPTGTQATGTLTLTGQPLDTETVTIGTQVYTFQTVLVDAPDNVLIGASASASLDNLIAAINADSGAGTTYGTGTVANTDATAAAGAGDTMDLTAIAEGVLGNTVATTETLTNGSFGGATLSGGVTADSIIIAAHGWVTAQGPFKVSNSGGALPAGLSDTELYWLYKVDTDTLTLHLDRVQAGRQLNRVDMTDAGSGTQTLEQTSDKDALPEYMRQGIRSESVQAATDTGDLISLTG